MLLSRGTNILRNIYHFNKGQQKIVTLNQTRKCWAYRTSTKPQTSWLILSELMGGMMWWWIFWHVWYDYKHLIGHYPDINPSDWSDEDLGVPTDD